MVACTLHVGATLPRSANVRSVALNGSPARYLVRDSNAGRQVLVTTPRAGRAWRVHIVAT